MDPDISACPLNICYDLDDNESFCDLHLCVIPVLVRGGSGEQMFDFLVDTGAQLSLITPFVANAVGVSSLTSASVRSYGLSRCTTELAKASIGLRSETNGYLDLGECPVIIGDLQGKFKDYQILGLLGANALRACILEINYPTKSLRLAISR